MKKLFSAFTAVLLAFCFISCAPQELSDRSSKNEGSVSLSIRSPRTISPAEGISYKDVEVWNVTFRDTTTTYDDIEKTVSFIGSESQEIRLPVGTYDVIFEGSVINQKKDSVVPFYGKDSVTVVGGTTVPISVFVAPKKSADGTGSFNFTVTTSGFGNNPPTTNIVDISTGRNNYFTVSLTPRGDEIPVATWTPTEISSSATTSETGDIYSFSVSSDTLELQSVPSGFYTLSIKYTWVVGEDSIGQLLTKTKEIYSPYHDFLVEIIDGLTTNGSADITVSLEDSKTYYATTDATKAKGNGAFASMPGYFDDVLAAIKDTTISTANIIMVDSLDSTTLTITYPEIDVSKVNATGKTYNIYTKNETQEYSPSYTITGAAVEGGNPTIYTEVGTVNLKDSSAAGKTVDVCNNTGLEQLSLSLKDSTSVAIDFRCSVILDKIDSFDYYSTHPFMTAKYPISSLELSSTLASYTTASKTISASEYEYYILPAVQANPIINGFAYDLVVTKDGLSVTDTLLYAGDTVTITATSKSEGGSFADGTTFVWFINGKRTDCTDQSYTIKFGEGDAVAENTIICLVGYGTEYSTAQITLTAVENTVVLYNNTLDTAKSALSYATLTGSSISPYPSELIASDGRTQIEDFCFDASNNMYALVYNGINYSINKYTYNNGYSTSYVTTYTCSDTRISTINNIETSDTGDLYAVIYAGDDNGGYADYIAKLTLQNQPEATDGTIVFDYYTSPTEWASYTVNIETFCTDGTYLYTIARLSTYDEYGIETAATIELAKNSITGNELSKVSGKTLDSYVNDQQSDTTVVFNGYNDSLEYRDLCYINGKLYLLVRDVELSTSSQYSTLYSRGALCTFIVSDSGITAEKIDTGYQKTSSSFSYTGSYETETSSYPTIKRTTYFGDGSLTFYGPVKFIARKEDELIIADDGYSVTEEDYASTEGHKQGTVSSKNAVVTYNLKTESLNFVSLDGEYFEEKYSGYFYSSGFFNQ